MLSGLLFQAGDKNAFFTTGRMLPQTGPLIRHNEGLWNVEPAVVAVCFPAGFSSLPH